MAAAPIRRLTTRLKSEPHRIGTGLDRRGRIWIAIPCLIVRPEMIDLSRVKDARAYPVGKVLRRCEGPTSPIHGWHQIGAGHYGVDEVLAIESGRLVAADAELVDLTHAAAIHAFPGEWRWHLDDRDVQLRRDHDGMLAAVMAPRRVDTVEVLEAIRQYRRGLP